MRKILEELRLNNNPRVRGIVVVVVVVVVIVFEYTSWLFHIYSVRQYLLYK